MSSNPWFVPPRVESNARLRLFLFPYAGGGPAVFGNWASGFPNDIETWIAHYPGRGSRYSETPVKELDNLVEGLAHAIQPLIEKPFAFFGHSLGGLVAFELARYLKSNHLPQPIAMFISGCAAPQLPGQHPPLYSLTDAEFLSALKQFNGIPTELLQQPDAMELLLPILRADFQTVETYRFIPPESPLEIPIIALGGLDDPRVSREALEEWATQTSTRFKSIYFPGDHFFFNSAKNEIVRTIAEEMMSSLPAQRKPAWRSV